MKIFILLISVLLLNGCAPMVSKPPFEWSETSYASLGTALMIKEKSREASGNTRAGTLVRFEIRAKGFSPDETLVIWDKKEMNYRKMPVTIRSDGQVLIGGEDGMALGGFRAGQAINIALVSETTGKRAHAKFIPFPVEARSEGGCIASAELVTGTGQVFLIHLKGFVAKETIHWTSRFKTGVGENDAEMSENGEARIPVMFEGYDNGEASFTAAGQHCSVTLNYKIGKDTMYIQ